MFANFLSPQISLEDAKAWLRKRFEKGATCPCCGQYVKLYKRKLNTGQAAALCIMYRWHSRYGWENAFDSKLLLFKGKRFDADFAKLRFWKIIARCEEERRYVMTERGREFVEGRIQVPKYIYAYNDGLVARDKPDQTLTTIRDALGDKFDYDELLNATPDGTAPTGESF